MIHDGNQYTYKLSKLGQLCTTTCHIAYLIRAHNADINQDHQHHYLLRHDVIKCLKDFTEVIPANVYYSIMDKLLSMYNDHASLFDKLSTATNDYQAESLIYGYPTTRGWNDQCRSILVDIINSVPTRIYNVIFDTFNKINEQATVDILKHLINVLFKPHKTMLTALLHTNIDCVKYLRGGTGDPTISRYLIVMQSSVYSELCAYLKLIDSDDYEQQLTNVGRTIHVKSALMMEECALTLNELQYNLYDTRYTISTELVPVCINFI